MQDPVSKNNGAVRVRFAPSPTGELHIGGLRSAIFNWLFARHNSGKFLVRIEDTDRERSKPEYLEAIVRSLEWMRMEPDEQYVIQSENEAKHREVVAELLARGLAYRCVCEPKVVTKEEKKSRAPGSVQLSCPCRERNLSEEEIGDRPYAVRFKVDRVNRSRVEFEDLIRGRVSYPTSNIEDFVIMRRDGTPTYNLSVVVDDIDMAITHVIRGEDHLSNTPKQILLYEALGASTPKFAHVPLILNPEGGKLSKRDAAVSVDEYRKMGILPDALFNYLVRLGWAHGNQEVFSREELIQLFTLDAVGKKGAVFDMEKLMWLNGVYIRELSFEDFLKHLSEADSELLGRMQEAWGDSELEKLFPLYAKRARSITAMARDMVALAEPCAGYGEEDLKKVRGFGDGVKPALERVAELLEKEGSSLSEKELLERAREIASEFGLKLVGVAQPLRLAVTCKLVSPGIFELVKIVGETEAAERARRLIERL